MGVTTWRRAYTTFHRPHDHKLVGGPQVVGMRDTAPAVQTHQHSEIACCIDCTAQGRGCSLVLATERRSLLSCRQHGTGYD